MWIIWDVLDETVLGETITLRVIQETALNWSFFIEEIGS